MNKTVNINLAGIFFHIDEDAYIKLQRYLEAIKSSFTDSQGRDEIVSDIEARIAELFTERVKHDKQVIGNKEVDEIISIMGQPEDYHVDEEIFEDEPKSSNKKSYSKKLFRDTENSYVGGVSSGLGHYFGLKPSWIRLIWIILIFGFGSGILLYILLWVLIPEAVSTSEKIQMKGENVTISNIEKKVRDSFDNVSESVKNVDFQKHGESLKKGIENVSDSISDSVKRANIGKQTNHIKNSSKTFFDTLGDVFMFILNLFAKFIGVILIFVGITTLIALTVAVITSSVTDVVHFGNINFEQLAYASGAPFWVISILLFFVFAIPFLFLFYLGLKILVKNLKPMGSVAKFSLFGLWLIALIGVIVLGVRQGLTFKEKASVIKTEKLESITAKDTLFLTMKNNDYFAEDFRRDYEFKSASDSLNEKVIFSQGIRLIVKSTRENTAKIKLTKLAKGSDFESARNRAENISYHYELVNNELKLDNYLIIPDSYNNIRDQEIEVTLYLPVGSVLFADKNTYYFHRNNTHRYKDILNNDMESHYLEVLNDELKCLDCTDEDDNDININVDINTDTSKLEINENGIEAKTDNSQLNIDADGLKAKTDNVNVKIDDNGIEITSNKKQTN